MIIARYLMMNNPHRHLFRYCKQERERAAALSQSSNYKMKQNAIQAFNAWDELAGQLYKPKPVDSTRFEQTKQIALRIVALMSNGIYKAETRQKILNLTLR